LNKLEDNLNKIFEEAKKPKEKKPKKEKPPKGPKGRPKLTPEQKEASILRAEEIKKAKKKNTKVGRPRIYKDKQEYLKNQYAQRNARANEPKVDTSIDRIDNVLERMSNKELKVKYLDSLLEVIGKYEKEIMV
jgi:hypothetical protein